MVKLDSKWGETADSLFQRSIETGNRRLRERYLALALIASGRTLQQVAAQIKRRRQTVAEWIQKFNELGIAGLLPEFHSKVLPSLSEDEFTILRQLLARPPKENGFVGGRWRSRMVAELIEKTFHKSVHPETARRYLRRLKGAPNK